MPQPFFVLATQNPIEQDGTYALPEAQLDRFMMKLNVAYPSLQYEKEILKTIDQDVATEHILSAKSLIKLQKEVETIDLTEELQAYIAQLIVATRSSHPSIAYGSSPRGSLAVASLAKALAYIEGRKEVAKSDIQKILLPSASFWWVTLRTGFTHWQDKDLI